MQKIQFKLFTWGEESEYKLFSAAVNFRDSMKGLNL